MRGIIHEAGKPEGMVQKCKRCGEILTDYTNAMGLGKWTPSWWEGMVTVYKGNPTCTESGVGDDADLCPRRFIELPFSPEDIRNGKFNVTQ